MSDCNLALLYDRIKDGRYCKALVHDSPVAVLLADSTGAFLDANDAAAKFFGRPVEELKTMRFQQVTYRDDIVLSMEMLNTLTVGGQESFEMVKRYVTKKGTCWAAVRINAVRDKDGVMEAHIVHIIPLLGCTDDVIRDVVGKVAGRRDTIQIGRCSLVAIFAVMVIIEVLVHLLMK